MNKNKLSNLINTFAAPIATILGGLVLLFSPDTATVLIAAVIGWGLLITGVLLAVYTITGKPGGAAGIQAAVYIFGGIWLIKRPMSLAVAFGKLLGIGLLIGAVSGWRKSVSPSGRTIYLAEGIFGLVLLIAPLTATRTVYTIVGLILVATGVVMLVNKMKKNGRLGPGSGDIIDV